MKPTVLEQAGEHATWTDGRAPERLPHALWRSPLVEIELGQALLRLPTIGRFLVPLDGLPTVERRAGVDRTEVKCFVEGPVRALQALLGGHFALRGSAVLVNGVALVITGDSGVGKSALAAALMQAGASVVADGYVLFDAYTQPILRVARDRVDLWPDTVKALGMDAAAGELVRAGLTKRAFASQPPPTGPQVPVDRLVVLSSGANGMGPSATAEARSLDLTTGMRTVASLGYLRQAIVPLGLSDNHFQWLTSLISLRPVEVRRPSGDISESLGALVRVVLDE